ncbi:MAG: short-chain dehydrogenase [Chloroflexi bacterium RBG_19FT_COMBO_62_14]|nr:MAG: short-chain dehydrogenase [Chloroflexi bacterium RBG_19FT_COMBO_62_14]
MKKKVLVTGAAGGIGRATVEAFQAAGWEVIAVDRKAPTSSSKDVEVFEADVSLPDSVDELFDRLSGKTESLEALINNAAIQICKPLIEMEPHEWDAVMASNLRSVYLTARRGYPLLRKARGSIVNVSSVHALATSVDLAAYAASKGALMALTRAMALEFAPDGIRVNAILPGAVDTQMLRDGLGRGHVTGLSMDDRLKALGKRTALGRVGQPLEIARAIQFLVDDDQSSFMTGQAMIVDGGATARLSTE